jgi:CRISPR-associated protein Csh1
MIESVYKIGKLIGKFNEEAYAKEYDDNVEADYVITIDFDKKGEFKRVDQEKFSKERLSKYFYKKAKGSNPPTYSPTLYLNKKDVSKTLKNLQKILKKIKKVNLENAQEKEIVNNIIKHLESKEKDLEEEIKKMSSDKDILTIRIDDQYVGEIDFLRKAIAKIVSDEGRNSLGTGICSLCLEEKQVSGNISPYKFYTIDKPGYITGGFDEKKAYKNFPLCYDCKRYIELGIEKIEKELKFKIMGSLVYYLIPDFTLDLIDDEKMKIVYNTLFGKSIRDPRLTNEQYDNLISQEDTLKYILEETQDILIYNFLFLEESNSARIINLYVQDIYPSRLKEMFEIKYLVESILPKEKSSFTYSTMYNFFSDEKKYFLELIDKTFKAIKLDDEQLFIYFLLKRIREFLHLNDKQYKAVIQDAYRIFLFVKLTTKEAIMEKEDVKKITDAKSIREFVESLPALDSPAKRALFLMGVLTEHVLWAQYKDKKSKHFMKKLNGLKMNATDIVGLLPEIRNKLEEYDEYSSSVAKIFLEASKNFSEVKTLVKTLEEMSIELNFYFVLGMGMYDDIAEKFIFAKKEENHGNQENHEKQA